MIVYTVIYSVIKEWHERSQSVCDVSLGDSRVYMSEGKDVYRGNSDYSIDTYRCYNVIVIDVRIIKYGLSGE